MKTIWGIPADTASTRIKSSPAVHLEVVAMFSVEYLASDERSVVTDSTDVPPFKSITSSPVVRDISRGAPTPIAVPIKPSVCVEMFRYRRGKSTRDTMIHSNSVCGA